MADQAVWKGASGASYTFVIYPVGTEFNAVSGNYIYAKIVGNYWKPIYIGEGVLKERIGPSHHQAACIRSKGATHVHAHVNSNDASRKSEESDLLAGHPNAYVPEGCNQKAGG